MAKPRLYHGSALLLFDGRVLVAGNGRYGVPEQDQLNGEIFSPPYLFKGPRPIITSAPTTILPASNFTVTTPDASRITSVSLIRLGAMTHNFNQDQRFLKLTFQQASNNLTIQSPADHNLAPPGHYMLFLVDSNGIPSVASIVQMQ
jgi:hypothetical protein